LTYIIIYNIILQWVHSLKVNLQKKLVLINEHSNPAVNVLLGDGNGIYIGNKWEWYIYREYMGMIYIYRENVLFEPLSTELFMFKYNYGYIT